MRRNSSSLSLVGTWLPRLLLCPNAAAFSNQLSWTRREHSRRTPSATQGLLSSIPSSQPLTTTTSSPQLGLSHPSTTSTSRSFSADANTAQNVSTNEEDRHLLDPYDILRGLSSNQNQTNQDIPKIPLPTYLSPSSLETFHKCPQAFLFLYILKLTADPPMTPQLARGTICHTALEEIFDLSPGNRNLANLENLFRREWSRIRGDRGDNALVASHDEKDNKSGLNKVKTSKKDAYNVLFREEGNDSTTASHDIDAEIEWGRQSLDILRNYYELEDPKTVKIPNPLMREMWVQARFPSENYNEMSEFVVRGIIDRIDILPSPSDKLQLEIIDYKTGKKPHFKYSQRANDRIAAEQFWKMKVYALILWKMILQTDEASEKRRVHGQEQGQQKEYYKFGMSGVLQQRLTQATTHIQRNKWSNILELNSLRLMYLTSHLEDASVNDSTKLVDGRTIGKASNLDSSLQPPSEFQSILDQTELEVQTIAEEIKRLVDTQSLQAFEHCDWRYCSCHELRQKLRPGSVYCSPGSKF